MAVSKTRPPWLRPFIIAVVLVVAPAALYWFAYVTQRVGAWEHQAQLVLNGVGRQLQAEVEYTQRVAVSSPLLVDSLLPGDPSIAGTPEDERGPPVWLDGNALVFRTKPGKAPSRRKRIPLTDLVPLAPRGYFDGFLVLDGKSGALIAESDELARLPLDLPVDLRSNNGDRLRLEQMRAVPAEATKEAKAEGARADVAAVSGLLGLGRYPSIDVGGTAYAALLEPVRISVAGAPDTRVDTGADSRIDLVFCGLVSEGHLRSHALELSPVALAWIAALVLLMFLVLPYVKIRFMGRRERLRTWDMWLLAGSALLGTGIATLFVLQLEAHHQLIQAMDGDLVRLHEAVRSQVDAEIGTAFEQLQRSAALLAKEPLDTDRGAILASRDHVFDAYPHFEALMLTDREKQIRKWMPRTLPTPLVKLTNQPWFARVLDLRAEASPYLLDVIVAPTSKLDLAVIAVPANLAADPPELGLGVPLEMRTGAAAIATELISVRDVVVPEPFGLAVVGSDGVVAFADALHNREDFFVAAPGVDRLLRAVSAGPSRAPASAPSDYRYRGQMHRMTATPLWDGHRGSLPMLVSFYDKRPIEALAAQVLVNAAAWLLLLVVACLVAAAAARVLDHRALEWAWPTRRRSWLYGAGCGVFVLLAGAILAGSSVLPAWAIPYLVIGAPAFTLFALPLATRWLPPDASGDDKSARPPHYPASYVAFTVLGLVATIAAPIAVVFRDSLAAHRAAFEEAGRRDYQERSEQQALLTGRRYSTVGAQGCGEGSNPCEAAPASRILITAANQEVLLARQRDFTSHPPEGAASIALPPTGSSPESWCEALWTFDRERLPRNHFSLALDACVPSWLRAPITADSPLATVDAAGIAPLPRPIRAPAVGVWVLLALAGLVALLWWFVRSVAVRILGLDLEGDGVIDRSREVVEGRPLNVVLLRPSQAELEIASNLVEKEGGRVIDLGESTRLPEHLDPIINESKLAVALLGVESRLVEKIWRQKLLLLLEAPREASLVLVSALDPLYFVLHRGRDLGDDSVSVQETERWSRALERFDKIRYPEPEPKLDPPRSGRRWVLDWVREECRRDDRLVEIGNTLLQRIDLDRFDEDDLAEYFLDAAESHYRALWSLCTIEERLVLVQLAEEGLVNPRCFDLLRRLRRRRLIRVDPRFRLVNESFRRFVLEAEERATVARWEREGAADSSTRVRGPLLALSLVAAGILLLTQGRALADALGYASAAGGVLAAVATVIASVRKLGVNA